MASPIRDAQDANAVGPKRVQVGSRTVEQFSPAELEELVKREAAQAASTNKRFGLRMQKMRPPGGGA